MSDFFRPSPPSPGSSDQAARKAAVMDNIRSEIALANAQELMNKVNEKCFAKCITSPSTQLSRNEENCLSNCLMRYMDVFNIVSKTYVNILAQNRSQSRLDNEMLNSEG